MLKMSMTVPLLAGLALSPMLGEERHSSGTGRTTPAQRVSDISDRATRSRALLGKRRRSSPAHAA